MTCKILDETRAGIEAAPKLATLGELFGAAAQRLGAPFFRVARYAPIDLGTPRFEVLAECVPDEMKFERLVAANPAFHATLRALFEREAPFDNHDDDGKWRIEERHALSGDAMCHAGITHHITVPRFGCRGVLGYAILFLRSEIEDPAVREALCLLACSAVRRATDLASAADGGQIRPLTPRQLQALVFCAEGKSDWDIARLMGVSPTTVHGHIEQAKRRIGVKTRVQAVVKAVQAGWLAA